MEHNTARNNRKKTKAEVPPVPARPAPPPWLVRRPPEDLTVQGLHVTGRQLYLVVVHGLRTGLITPDEAAVTVDSDPDVTEARTVALVCASGAFGSYMSQGHLITIAAGGRQFTSSHRRQIPL